MTINVRPITTPQYVAEPREGTHTEERPSARWTNPPQPLMAWALYVDPSCSMMHVVRLFSFYLNLLYSKFTSKTWPKINYSSKLNHAKASLRQGASSRTFRGRFWRGPLPSQGGAGVAASPRPVSASPKQCTIRVQCSTYFTGWSYQALVLETFKIPLG